MRSLVLFLIGAVFGTLLDRLHVVFNVLGYPNQALWGQAPWVPVLFGAATLSLVHGHAFSSRMLGAPRDPAPMSSALVAIGLFAIAYATTAVLDFTPWATLALVGTSWIAFTAATRRFSRGFVLYSVSTALIGTFIETVLTQAGFFFYLRPTLLSVTVWLPALYLWAATVGATLDRATAPRVSA